MSMRHIPVVVLAALLFTSACSFTQPDSRTPEEIVSEAISVTAEEDWGGLDALLTKRLNLALNPGSLSDVWLTNGTDLELVDTLLVGQTAHVWVQGQHSILDLSRALQVNTSTLSGWLAQPDPNDPQYLRSREQVAAISLQGESLVATSRITLYRQPEGWRIESWAIAPLPGTLLPSLEPPSDSEQTEQNDSEPTEQTPVESEQIDTSAANDE